MILVYFNTKIRPQVPTITNIKYRDFKNNPATIPLWSPYKRSHKNNRKKTKTKTITKQPKDTNILYSIFWKKTDSTTSPIDYTVTTMAMITIRAMMSSILYRKYFPIKSLRLWCPILRTRMVLKGSLLKMNSITREMWEPFSHSNSK